MTLKNLATQSRISLGIPPIPGATKIPEAAVGSRESRENFRIETAAVLCVSDNSRYIDEVSSI